MKLYLVNPGKHESGELNEEGIRQIKLLARRLTLDRTSIDRIYANGHLVSVQSGGILSRALRIPLVRDERFIDFDFRSLITNPFSVDADNLELIYFFVDEIVRRGKDAVIAMDGGIHRAVISRLTGLSLADTRHFELMPASLSVLQYHSMDGIEGWRLSVVNDTTHLRVP